jgi:hypothetical protein
VAGVAAWFPFGVRVFVAKFNQLFTKAAEIIRSFTRICKDLFHKATGRVSEGAAGLACLLFWRLSKNPCEVP